MREQRSERPEDVLGPGGVLQAWVSMFASHDAIMFAYLLILAALIWAAPAGPEQAAAGRMIQISLSALFIGCFTGRLLTGLSATFRSTFYRAIIVGILITNYLALRDVLVLVRPDTVDDVLFRLDLRVFGVEPALWLERFNRRLVVEWFSFFYFSYFFISLAYMLKMVWWSRDGRATAEFANGVTIVFTVGQLGYLAVPGYGPIHHLQGAFHGPVDGGFFWSCVQRTVAAGGAMKDIFPSLHTAVPLYFALFAYRLAARDRRMRWAARVTAFFSLNIIVSTMLLRWHYGVDVVAGVLLGVGASWAAPRLVAFETAARRKLRMREPFEFAAEPTAGPVSDDEDAVVAAVPRTLHDEDMGKRPAAGATGFG
ncbi:Hypothetical protein A7982_08363 [Minicystis rosea]|nr:Hypothetical protein A7982_08363 [Minicystis rosea]